MKKILYETAEPSAPATPIASAPAAPSVPLDVPDHAPAATSAPSAPSTPPEKSVLSIIEALNKPTASEVTPPSVSATGTEKIKQEIIQEAASDSGATAPGASVTPKPLTAADIALNKMFARSMVEGADELNSFGCKEVSGEEKKEIFQAADKNKDELAQFIVLIMEKNGGKVPIWLYGIWLAGKTFGPPWILVVKLRGKNKLIKKLTQEAEAAKNNTSDELRKKEEEIARLKTDLEATQKANVEVKTDLIPGDEKKKHIEKIAAELDNAEIPLLPGQKQKDGTIYAPYGLKPDGTVKRSNGGRKPKSNS